MIRTNSPSVNEIVSTGRGWRVRVSLPTPKRGKRLFSVIVRGCFTDARRVRDAFMAENYPPPPRTNLRKCSRCQREYSLKDYRGHYPKLSNDCANCRDKAKGRQPIGPRLRFSVFSRDGFACCYCGRKAPSVVLHVDHVVPVSKGGLNVIENLVTACADCNLGKSDLSVTKLCAERAKGERREHSGPPLS